MLIIISNSLLFEYISKIEDEMSNTPFTIYKNKSLKNYCTFHLGGKAKYIFEVYTTLQLLSACKFCEASKIKYKVIGFGSNLLFDDKGYNGAIIVNRTDRIRFYKNSCFVDSGVAINTLIKRSLTKKLSGLENLVLIPSTIGGGIVNNVGAFDKELAEHVEYVECYKVGELDKKVILWAKDCSFKYRDSLFRSQQYLITKVKINLIPDSKTAILERLNRYVYQKSSSQPINQHSAGSVFKRTSIIPASKLIDDLGLKGLTVGGASVSKKHAGFIITDLHAKSKDVQTLIGIIKDKVLKSNGTILEEEIEYVKY